MLLTVLQTRYAQLCQEWEKTLSQRQKEVFSVFITTFDQYALILPQCRCAVAVNCLLVLLSKIIVPGAIEIQAEVGQKSEGGRGCAVQGDLSRRFA